jgi:hypothetical protein
MSLPTVFTTYADYVTQQLLGGFLKKPDVVERLNKAKTDPGELSRLFNSMPTRPDLQAKLYDQFFTQDPFNAYPTMHQVVQVTLKRIQEQAHAIQQQLPLEHQKLLSTNYIIQALMTLYSMELNNAFNQLPEERKEKEQDNFMYFRRAMDTYAQQLSTKNIHSKEPIQLSNEAREERINYLSEMWEMNNDNQEKIQNLKSKLEASIPALTNYLERNSSRMSEEKRTQLTQIKDELQQCRNEIHNNLPFASTYMKVGELHRELVTFKQELREDRQTHMSAQVSHQITKFVSPLKTLSGITAHFKQAYDDARPDFIPVPVTQHYKDKLADMAGLESRKSSNATELTIQIDENATDTTFDSPPQTDTTDGKFSPK